MLAGSGWGAEGHANSVDSAELTTRGGFARFEASFKDTGAGSSKIAVWIEVYDGSGASADSHTVLARKSGKSTCQAGRTCVTLLRTVVQLLRGECYVGRASSTSEEGTSEKQSPANGRLCP
jgi:hypothetical protein